MWLCEDLTSRYQDSAYIGDTWDELLAQWLWESCLLDMATLCVFCLCFLLGLVAFCEGGTNWLWLFCHFVVTHIANSTKCLSRGVESKNILIDLDRLADWCFVGCLFGWYQQTSWLTHCQIVLLIAVEISKFHNFCRKQLVNKTISQASVQSGIWLKSSVWHSCETPNEKGYSAYCARAWTDGLKRAVSESL